MPPNRFGCCPIPNSAPLGPAPAHGKGVHPKSKTGTDFDANASILRSTIATPEMREDGRLGKAVPTALFACGGGLESEIDQNRPFPSVDFSE